VSRRLSAALIVSAAATLATPASAAVVQVHLTAREAVVHPAPNLRMRAWTFDGTVPGPVIRVREGDIVQVTLRNAGPRKDAGGHPGVWHSVDFHAAELAPDIGFAGVAPGKQRTFSFVASHPGVFLYHCGTAPMLMHVGMGMYGAIIVDPAQPLPPAREVVLVQSEFYGSVRRGVLTPTLAAMQHGAPRVVAFNGRAMRYASHPIHVPVGSPVRIYLVDAGPTLDSAFHVVGAIFDDGISTELVPPGGGAILDLSFPAKGTYPFVTHALRWADAGAMGRFVAR
jgi:nitrite reductase (NO-forming)